MRRNVFTWVFWAFLGLSISLQQNAAALDIGDFDELQLECRGKLVFSAYPQSKEESAFVTLMENGQLNLTLNFYNSSDDSTLSIETKGSWIKSDNSIDLNTKNIEKVNPAIIGNPADILSDWNFLANMLGDMRMVIKKDEVGYTYHRTMDGTKYRLVCEEMPRKPMIKSSLTRLLDDHYFAMQELVETSYTPQDRDDLIELAKSIAIFRSKTNAAGHLLAAAVQGAQQEEFRKNIIDLTLYYGADRMLDSFRLDSDYFLSVKGGKEAAQLGYCWFANAAQLLKKTKIKRANDLYEIDSLNEKTIDAENIFMRLTAPIEIQNQNKVELDQAVSHLRSVKPICSGTFSPSEIKKLRPLIAQVATLIILFEEELISSELAIETFANLTLQDLFKYSFLPSYQSDFSSVSECLKVFLRRSGEWRPVKANYAGLCFINHGYSGVVWLSN